MIQESKRGYSKKDGIWRPDPMKYKPIRKNKLFDPSPVAGNIPFYADVMKNPNVLGTVACNEFWDEQFDRCKNGYETGGIYIPGRYYYYLNFGVLEGVYGKFYPWYTDLDLEFFRAIEYVKENHMLGIIAPKARRKGLSEKGHSILQHGVRFIEGYAGAVAAGLSNYIVGIRTKMDKATSLIRDELKLAELKRNEDQIKYGYLIKNSYGKIEEDGFNTQLRFATMFDKATKLEGEYFHDVIMEESGQFPLLGETIESIKPALMMGSVLKGTFYVYGTGGNILSSSKDFLRLWSEADNFNLLKFFVGGQRFYFPFLGLQEKTIKRHNEKAGKEDQLIPRMQRFEDAGWKPYEYVGCDDVEGALKDLKEKEQMYAKMKDKKRLIEHKQNFPTNPDEAFTAGGSNNFDTEILYIQKHLILTEAPVPVKDMVLEFVKEKNEYGVDVFKIPLEVIARPATPKDKPYNIIKMIEDPVKDGKFDYIGVDSYEMDKTQTSKSLGGIMVVRDYRKAYNLNACDVVKPVAWYYDRPPRKEMFFEQALKLAVFFNTKRRTMLSAEHESIIKFFRTYGGTKYLALRPKCMDSPKTEQIHKFGVKMTPYSKPKALGLAQSYIYDYGNNIWSNELIDDLLAYDEENIGTDWDLADAYMNALICIQEFSHKVIKAPPKEIRDQMPIYGYKDGQLVVIKSIKKERISSIQRSFNQLKYKAFIKSQPNIT